MLMKVFQGRQLYVDHSYANGLSKVMREVSTTHDSDGVAFGGADPGYADLIMRCWVGHRPGVKMVTRGNGRHNSHYLLDLLTNLDW